MVVGVCKLVLHFPESGSLKHKRKDLRSLIDRVRAKFNTGIAEVGGQDTWQRSVVGFSVVGNEMTHVRQMVETIRGFIESTYLAQVTDHEDDIFSYQGERP